MRLGEVEHVLAGLGRRRRLARSRRGRRRRRCCRRWRRGDGPEQALPRLVAQIRQLSHHVRILRQPASQFTARDWRTVDRDQTVADLDVVEGPRCEVRDQHDALAQPAHLVAAFNPLPELRQICSGRAHLRAGRLARGRDARGAERGDGQRQRDGEPENAGLPGILHAHDLTLPAGPAADGAPSALPPQSTG